MEEDYNDVDTYGARAALRIELDENWTVTPTFMAQEQRSHGIFGDESGLDEFQVQQFNPEFAKDRWYQAALTVQGRIGNFDLTYAGAYMQRQIDSAFGDVDYAYFYDALAGYAQYFTDNNGNQVNPNQYVIADDSFTRLTQELRITSPVDRPVRLVAGLFYQRQTTISSRTTSSTISPTRSPCPAPRATSGSPSSCAPIAIMRSSARSPGTSRPTSP